MNVKKFKDLLEMVTNGMESANSGDITPEAREEIFNTLKESSDELVKGDKAPTKIQMGKLRDAMNKFASYLGNDEYNKIMPEGSKSITPYGRINNPAQMLPEHASEPAEAEMTDGSTIYVEPEDTHKWRVKDKLKELSDYYNDDSTDSDYEVVDTEEPSSESKALVLRDNDSDDSGLTGLDNQSGVTGGVSNSDNGNGGNGNGNNDKGKGENEGEEDSTPNSTKNPNTLGTMALKAGADLMNAGGNAYDNYQNLLGDALDAVATNMMKSNNSHLTSPFAVMPAYSNAHRAKGKVWGGLAKGVGEALNDVAGDMAENNVDEINRGTDNETLDARSRALHGRGYYKNAVKRRGEKNIGNGGLSTITEHVGG